MNLLLKKLEPSLYFDEFFKAGLRSDGRRFSDTRELTVLQNTVPSADGSCTVTLGSTSVVAGAVAEVAEPLSSAPEEGFVTVNVDLPPLCAVKYKGPSPNEKTQVLSHVLSSSLARIVDLKSLCITGEKLVWHIRIDAICINDQGNALDAFWMAILGCLQCLRLPDVEMNERGVLHATTQRYKPLVLLSLPLFFSFAVYQNKHVLADPSGDEEESIASTVRVLVDGCSVLHVEAQCSEVELAHALEAALGLYPSQINKLT